MKKPIKIILALALVAVLALSFTACSGSSDETTTTAPTTEAVSDTAQNDGEDGQNPVMNFIGNYDNGGTTILVEADAKDGAEGFGYAKGGFCPAGNVVAHAGGAHSNHSGQFFLGHSFFFK